MSAFKDWMRIIGEPLSWGRKEWEEAGCRFPEKAPPPPLPKPKLATVRNAPSRDEFAAWRQDPTTAFVMAALLRNAVECEDKWFIDSWEAGKADQRTLDGLRERADALRGIAEADYEAFCETLNLEPEPLHGDAA